MSESTSHGVTIQAALDDYMLVHEINRSSSYTLKNFRKVLSIFLAWLHTTYNLVYVDELTIVHLRAYVAHLQHTPSKHGTPFSDTSVNHYAKIIRSFCHWMEREDLIDKPITARFSLPKVEQDEIPALTMDDFNKLLAACEEGDSRSLHMRKALTARNRAIVTVLFDTGIRRSELAGLRLGDIDRDLRLLYVHRKGNKWQQVPITQDGFRPLHEYITKHRSHLASQGVGTGSKKTDPVFLGSRGEPLKPTGITELFERLRDRAGIEGKPVYPHQGRRFMATTQLEAGRSPLEVQRQMGHSTLMMTNRYYSQTVGNLRKSHDLYGPLRAKKADFDSSTHGSGYGED
jgi:site-specific recombinase XerD